MVSSRTLFSIAAAVLLQTATVQAQQPFKPPGNSEMAYASIPDKTLYIQGGVTLHLTNDFYSLDLTQDSWPVSSPPWTSRTAPSIVLTPTSRAGVSNGMTVTRDQKRLVIWAEPGVFWMDIATGLWQSEVVGNATTAATMRYNYRRAATHGDTGLIFIPGGADQGRKMVVLNPETFAVSMVDMPSAWLPGVIGLYGWVWSDFRKSFLLTGGELMDENNVPYKQSSAAFWEYFPGNNTWTPLVANGARLPLISRHCMIQGYGGRRIVLYGGHEWNGGEQKLRGSIFVLDVPTMTWAQGEPINVAYLSTDSACTLTGTNFITWGGSEKTANKESLATPVIFDVETMRWITQFQKQAAPPPLSTTSTSPTSPSPSAFYPTSPDSKGSTVAAIAGGCAGAVVMLGLVGLVFWMRQRRRNAEYTSVAINAAAAGAPGVDGGAGKGAGGVAGVASPQTPNTFNNNTQQANFRKEPESGRGPYGHYQDGYVSPLNVGDPPTVHTIPGRNPQQNIDVYHEFPNDNIQRHPQATPGAFY
ncbi:hypothetical protein BG004_002647 [Podila humilis]|nr:hypothetical protein BG004_002647 [Podila humilis]